MTSFFFSRVNPGKTGVTASYGLGSFFTASNSPPRSVTRWDLTLPFHLTSLHFLISYVSQILFHSPVSNQINGSLPPPLYKSPALSFSSSGEKIGLVFSYVFLRPTAPFTPLFLFKEKRTKRWRMRLPDSKALYLIPPFLLLLSH